MGIFSQKKDTGELEDELEKLELESSIASKKSEIAEREAVIKELKAKYGKDWKKVLGVDKFLDTQSLKSLLTGSHKGMNGMANQFTIKQEVLKPNLTGRRLW